MIKLWVYICQGDKYAYSEASRPLGAIVTMWDPNKINGIQIYFNPYFLVVSFTDDSSDSIIFTFYDPTTRGVTLQVWVEASAYIANHKTKLIRAENFNTLLYTLEILVVILDVYEIMHDLDVFLRRNKLIDMELKVV